MTQPHSIVVTGPLLTTNRERAGSRYLRAAIVKEWRTTACLLALAQRFPKMDAVHVIVYPYQAKGRLADAGGHLPTVKAVVDGLVDAGVLEDDSPAYVHSITMHAPTRTDKDAVKVVLVPVATMDYPV